MAAEDKKQSVGPVTFVRQVRAEGNKVTWTSRQETIAATIMVIVMSILIALYLFSVDAVIGWLVSMITGLGGQS
ncbi:MAG: preprotein translocase subunit SecE [Hyphomonadaceae bacterium]|nr:preprotein translocase subunit SecE [Hyphomonadaceae bacterium]